MPDSVVGSAVARFPSIAATTDPVYVVGNDIAFFGPDLVQDNPLVVLELGGHRLSAPPGAFRFAFPRAIADEGNRLHLLWAEPSDASLPVSSAGWLQQKLANVWTATYTAGRGWSQPRTIYQGSRLGWRNAVVGTGDITAPPKWALSVVDLGHPGQRQVIVLFHVEDGQMVATVPDETGKAVQSSVASAGTDVFLGFISPIPREVIGPVGSDVNSVYLKVSHDGGRSWNAAMLVSRSGEFPAHGLRTLLSPDGSIHLVWRQTLARDEGAIRHVTSADGGRTWSQPDDLLLAPKASGLRAVADPCGRVHVVFEHWEAQTGEAHVDYATWRDGWSAIEHLFPALSVTGTALHGAPNGKLLLAFLARPAASPMDVPGVSMYSELRTE